MTITTLVNGLPVQPAAVVPAVTQVGYEPAGGGRYLPAPRIPHVSLPPAGMLAAVVGERLAEPVKAVEAALADAATAQGVLESNRPGPLGDLWRAALDSDAAAFADGKPPRKWATVALAEGDTARWVNAQVQARYIPLAVARCETQLDRAQIKSTADTVAQAHAGQWATEASAGWATRDDRATAWAHRKAADEHRAQFTLAMCVWFWGDRQGWDDPATAAWRPDNPEAAGCYEALSLFLEPGTRFLTLPRDVIWPADVDHLIDKAMGDPRGAVDLRNKGHHERKD